MSIADLLLGPLRSRVVTAGDARQPQIPDRGVRGLPVFDASLCTTTGLCEATCPTGAISGVNGSRAIDYGRCISCGTCIDACASGALGATNGLAPHARSREALIAPSEEAGARLAGAVSGRLRRSLHVRHLDTGSCNGCDWEMTATLNPVYDLQRFGIDFVASPRHADVLMVTGTMTRNLAQAARMTYEAMPEPRIVVAVGACAAGGMFGASYATGGGTASLLPVDVYVPGCPPRPEALIRALLAAVQRIS